MILARQKSGSGKEQWGNQRGVSYLCGMSFKHKGRGYCRYEGEFQNGVFHGLYRAVFLLHESSHHAPPYLGKGTYACIDGRGYIGDWRKGARCGLGKMILCPASERGNPARRCIGGLDGLYRPLSYCGRWVDGERIGHGRLIMMNGQVFEGRFVCGRLDGRVEITFCDGSNRTELHHSARQKRTPKTHAESWYDSDPQVWHPRWHTRQRHHEPNRPKPRPFAVLPR